MELCCAEEKNKPIFRHNILSKCGDIALTKTICQKLVYMQMKLQAGIPTIINGETGVGKTCLVRYLSQMIEGTVFTLNVHAGRTQKSIIDWIQRVQKLNINSPEGLQNQKDKLLKMEQTDSNMEIIDRIDDVIETIQNARQMRLDKFLAEQKSREGFERLKQLRESLRSDNKQGLSDEDKQKLATQFKEKHAQLCRTIEQKVDQIWQDRNEPNILPYLCNIEGWAYNEADVEKGKIGDELEMMPHLLSEQNAAKTFKQLFEEMYAAGGEALQNMKFILFLDEVNTNKNIEGVLKEILVDNKLCGERLSPNMVVLAATNPYIFKSRRENENVDLLKVRMASDQKNAGSANKLVYHVYPMAESQNAFVWNFGKLESEDEQLIIKRMVFNEKFLHKNWKTDESGQREIKIGEPVKAVTDKFRQFIADVVFTC